MDIDIENLKKRLIYKSQYRGTKEKDKLVGSFVQYHIEKLNTIELNELEEFLNIDDDTLYKFYNGQIKDVNFTKSRILKLFENFDYKK